MHLLTLEMSISIYLLEIDFRHELCHISFNDMQQFAFRSTVKQRFFRWLTSAEVRYIWDNIIRNVIWEGA